MDEKIRNLGLVFVACLFVSFMLFSYQQQQTTNNKQQLSFDDKYVVVPVANFGLVFVKSSSGIVIPNGSYVNGVYPLYKYGYISFA